MEDSDLELSDEEKDENEFEPGIEEDAGGSDEQPDTDTETDSDDQERRRPLWVLFTPKIIYSIPVIPVTTIDIHGTKVI